MDAFDIIAVLVALLPILMLIVVNAAESLKSDPQLSNREHARRTGATDKTVGVVRGELESTAEIPQSETRVSGDGRLEQHSSRMSADGRERPASQPEPSGLQLSNREHARRTGASNSTVGIIRKEMEADGQVCESHTSLGADGKVYPASQPEPSGLQLSNREHARRTGVSHVPANAVREELEESGQIDHFERSAMEKSAKIPHFERREMETNDQMGNFTTSRGTLVPKPDLTPRPLAARPRRCNSSHFVTRGVPRVPAEVVNKGGA